MRSLLFFLIILTGSHAFAQLPSEQDKFVGRIRPLDNPPDGLLSNRAAFLFSADYTPQELEKIQKGFQQTGIDAVTYIESDIVVASADVKSVYAVRFNKRNVKFMIFARKEKNEYQFWFLPFNPKNLWTNPAPAAWMVHSARLQDLLSNIFRSVASSQKKQNFLVNELPEMESITGTFANTRNESMISNLKNFKVAVPGIGGAQVNQELSDLFATYFHGRFEITSDTLSDRELAQKGFRYIVRCMHAPGDLSKIILGYEAPKSESAIASATYPNGTLQLKPIPSAQTVFKFYIKDLEDKNLYLGTKWDADISWQDALKNHFDGYRISGRVN